MFKGSDLIIGLRTGGRGEGDGRKREAEEEVLGGHGRAGRLGQGKIEGEV